jgi:hypothetical protein
MNMYQPNNKRLPPCEIDNADGHCMMKISTVFERILMPDHNFTGEVQIESSSAVTYIYFMYSEHNWKEAQAIRDSINFLYGK